MRPACRRGRGQQRVDPVDPVALAVAGGALHLEGHERRAPVPGQLTRVARCERRADVRRVACRLDTPDDVADATANVNSGAARPGLYEHLLRVVALERGAQHGIRAARLAGPRGLRVAQLLRADRSADGEGDEYEGEPSEDGGLAM